MPLSRVDLPAPFGPTSARSSPAEHARDMMDGRMPLVAERDDAESAMAGPRCCDHTHASTHTQTRAHSDSRRSPAMARRAQQPRSAITKILDARAAPPPP